MPVVRTRVRRLVQSPATPKWDDAHDSADECVAAWCLVGWARGCGRFVFSLPLLFIFAIIARKNNLLQINNWFYVLLRSAFGLTTMLLVFLSLQLIPIGLVTALAQSSAIFVTILAPIFLGEKIGVKRWIAVLIGLFGVQSVL